MNDDIFYPVMFPVIIIIGYFVGYLSTLVIAQGTETFFSTVFTIYVNFCNWLYVTFIKPIVDEIKSIVTSIWNTIKGFFTTAKRWVSAMWRHLIDLFKEIFKVGRAAGGKIKDAAVSVAHRAERIAEEGYDILKGIGHRIYLFVKPFIDIVVKIFKVPYHFFKSVFKSIDSLIKKIL